MATAPDDWDDVESVCAVSDGWIPAFGAHPWYLPDLPLDQVLLRLEERLQFHPEAWAGEIGLDRTAGPPLALQEEWFAPQLKLAGTYQRPASLHCRRTWDRLGWYLKRRSALDVPVVCHSFGGSVAAAKQMLDLNAYLSFSGSVTRLRNERLPEVVRFVPRDRVLIETDSPDLLPEELWRQNPGKANEPANLTYVLKRIAELWGLTPEAAAEILETNFRKLAPLP